MTDYDSRAQQYGFAPKEDIRQTMSHPNLVLLDVRTPAEIAATGPFPAGDHAKHVASSCTPTECPELESIKCIELLPDKSAPIVIYCRSGRRAAKAEEVLKSKGYETVLNAGGLDDMGYLK